MSRYDPDWVREYYDELGEDEWHRWDRIPANRVKFHIHCHYLERYIKNGDRVLDVGAGPGRFTQVLAELGARIVVADISPVQLDLNRKNAQKYAFESAVEDWIKVDICNMGAFEDNEFDAVLCYGGPLSYVFEQRDTASLEILRILKPSGLALFSVMSLWGTVHEFLMGALGLPPEQNSVITQTGNLYPETHKGATHRCHMFRSEELKNLFGKHGFEVLSISASNCLSAVWQDRLPDIQQDKQKWDELLRMELEASKEPGSLDMGTHLIAVVRKP